jgi:hypothetical protein
MNLMEAIERLEAMEKDNGQTWDLSENDQMAIRIVLDEFARQIQSSIPQ